MEEAQEFLPELQFFDHVDYIKGYFRVTFLLVYVTCTFKLSWKYIDAETVFEHVQRSTLLGPS